MRAVPSGTARLDVRLGWGLSAWVASVEAVERVDVVRIEVDDVRRWVARTALIALRQRWRGVYFCLRPAEISTSGRGEVGVGESH